MKRIWLVLLGLVMGCGMAMAAPVKVIILDGQSGGTYHDWKLTSQIMKRQLEEAGLFEVAVVTAPPADADFSSFRPDFAKYQLVVSNYDAPDWPAFNEMIGVGGWRGRDAPAGPKWYYKDGQLDSDPGPDPAGMHGLRTPFRVTARAPQHPILRGLPPEWMHHTDELYTRLRGPGKNMTVLATAYADPANRGTGFDEPMLMALTFGKGRIFDTTLGHDATALSCVGFITTFQRGAEWAATGRVTQKAPKNFPTSDSVSYRPDLAAMDPAVAGGVPATSRAPAK
ncbi:MAG: hypothetical protein RJB58_1756 [Pseudomonadota bacterium]|jgi:hypothetical protein